MHSIAPYSIRVHDNSLPGLADKKYHKLDQIRGIDLLEAFKAFAEGMGNEYQEIVENKSKKAVKFSTIRKKERSVYGWIEYGDFGTKGKVVSIKTGDTVYAKLPDDSDIKQLYFHLNIPAGTTTGILLLHNVHGAGVKGVLAGLFNTYFMNITAGLRVRISPLTYENAVADWMKHSVVKELRLTKYKGQDVIRDPVDKLSENSIEVRYKPPKGGSFGKLWDLHQNPRHTGKNRGAVDILDDLCHSVKAVVELSGRKRVFSLSYNATPVSSIDFDEDDVDMDHGVPRINSIHAFCETVIEDMAPTLK